MRKQKKIKKDKTVKSRTTTVSKKKTGAAKKVSAKKSKPKAKVRNAESKAKRSKTGNKRPKMTVLKTNAKTKKVLTSTKSSIKKVRKRRKGKKVKENKSPKPVELTCILTGKCFRIGLTVQQKQSERLKFDSVEEYRQYYICKEARALLKIGETEDEIRKKFNCDNKTPIPFRILKCYVKKFKSKESIKRKKRNAIIKEFVNNKSNITVSSGKVTIPLSLNNAKHVEELTTGACWRPDLYLNNNKTCIGCPLFKDCKCELKKMPKYAK